MRESAGGETSSSGLVTTITALSGLSDELVTHSHYRSNSEYSPRAQLQVSRAPSWHPRTPPRTNLG